MSYKYTGRIFKIPFPFADAKIKLRIGNSPILISKNLTDEQYGRLPNTEIIMHRRFWVGVYPGMTEEMINYMIEKIREFVKDKGKKKEEEEEEE